MRGAPEGSGVGRIFDSSFERIARASKDAVVASGLGIEEFYEPAPGKLVIIAERSWSAFSWGERVRVAVYKLAPAQAEVWVYTQRKLATNITARGDWSDTIFSNIALELKYQSVP